MIVASVLSPLPRLLHRWSWIGLAVGQVHAADFVRDVRPIFEKHCYECHGAQKQKNDYRLDIKSIALTGGSEHAPNILPGKAEASPLIRFISGTDEKLQMPPKEKLSTSEIATLKQWINEGASWPESADTAKLEDKTDWWSFKPLPRSDGILPSMAAESRHSSNFIDTFIHAKLAEKGLKPSPPADPRTLIRRLTFDLTGLPPTPEEVAAFESECRQGSSFVIRDSSVAALTDRLLASPRYGERWARHWLDLVHYGETHGYDKDKPRNNAWPYRDYVIRALNQDKPYGRFVQEQLAGDVLYPGTTDGITALGFIAAGPWDYIGHAEVPETKIDGKIARHLDRDDMVQNAIGSFCSLTIQCAQCHNHKFDPITQEDYYSLQAVFAAIDRTDVDYFPDDASMQKFAAAQGRKKQLTSEITALESPLKKKAGEPYLALSRRIDGAADKGGNPNAKPDYGYHSAISPMQNVTKWVQVDLGRHRTVTKVVLKPCYDDFGKIGAGFGFPVRFKVEVSDDPEFKTGVSLLWRKHDVTFMNDFANPGLKAFETGGAADDGIAGRYVRVTAVKLAERKGDYIFALAELEAYETKDGPNVAAGCQVTALDGIEAPPRWRKVNLTDGIAPESRSADERQQLIRERDQLLLAQADAKTRHRLLVARDQMRALPSLPPASKVYAGAIHTGSGSFKGTGADGGKPRFIHVLKRGDINQPAKEVGPHSITALTSLLHLPFAPEGEDEGAHRAALAMWITDKNNALTWRSIVNRVWQHHFGRALVDTPNDFGRMGAKPSHPELLDALAVWFRDDAQGSLKALHKLIVMSETYRQSSGERSAKSEESPTGPLAREASASSSFALSSSLDSTNTLLWRQTRRKLDAESIRDSLLAVSGQLDLTMGGPSFQDFVVTHPEHSPHYEYALADPDDPKSHRRSIYRFIVRSQQQPFMTVMDCADPSMRVDKRNESLSPLQALALMNNGLTVAMAKHFAERVTKEATNLESQTRRAFALALSREPTSDELAPLLDYARREGMANACRVILNLNEFSFID